MKRDYPSEEDIQRMRDALARPVQHRTRSVLDRLLDELSETIEKALRENWSWAKIAGILGQQQPYKPDTVYRAWKRRERAKGEPRSKNQGNDISSSPAARAQRAEAFVKEHAFEGLQGKALADELGKALMASVSQLGENPSVEKQLQYSAVLEKIAAVRAASSADITVSNEVRRGQTVVDRKWADRSSADISSPSRMEF
jgi:hypothetical protein